MKRFTILVLLVLASILMILVAPPSPRQAYAQGGQLSGITWSGQVLTNRTTTGATTSGDGTQFTKGYFPNYGFASHWLTYCVNNVATIAIQLEGSDGNGTWTQISEQGTVASGCAILETGGYFPLVRVNVLTLTGASATVNAWYHASVFPIPGGGITATGRASIAVTYLPAGAYTNSALSSTLQSVSSTPGAVYGGFVQNTSAATVYLVIEDGSQTLNQSQIIVPIPANGVQPLTLPAVGVVFNTSIQAACTTSLSSLTAPASACVANIYFKHGTNFNNNLNIFRGFNP